MKVFGNNKFFYLFFVLSLIANASFGQVQSYESQHEKKYQERISKAYLYKTYIPKDVYESFKELIRLTDSKSIEKFKYTPEDVAVKKLHFSLGRWMILNWQFYEGSRLSHNLREMGITYPDDMASVLIRSFHRYLNKQPLDLKSQVMAIHARIEAERQAELEKSKVIDSFTRKRDKN